MGIDGKVNMSHRYKSSCCCGEEETVGICFTGFGAVPKTPFSPDNSCTDTESFFNRFDNWEMCSHDNDEEILLQVNRKAWRSLTATGAIGSDPCVDCGSCPPQNTGYGGRGEIPFYTWYASHESTKIIDEPGATINQCYDGGYAPDDGQVYVWYHTSQYANGTGRIDGFGSGRSIVGGENPSTLPLYPNPRDSAGIFPYFYPPGSESPCCCESFAGNSSTCDDTWCRRSFFSRCYHQISIIDNQPTMLTLPFRRVFSTPIPLTYSQMKLIGDSRSSSRWRTSSYGWLKSTDEKDTSCEDRLLKRCYHGGDSFWLQDIVQQSRFGETDKFYPHWEASIANGVLSVSQRYSFGECTSDPLDSEPPYYGWPLGKTVLAVFHKEKWWQRYWSSIDENDVCPDIDGETDTTCGTCPGWTEENGCPNDGWSPSDQDIYPGHFAACRTPKYVGQACAGVPIFTHEVMLNVRLLNTKDIPDIPESLTNTVGTNDLNNCAEWIIAACTLDWPIPKRLTDIMEEEGILPAPNPNLTEEFPEDDVAYRIFKKTLKHYDPTGGNLPEGGRCCVNIDLFDHGTLENPGPVPIKGDCGISGDLRDIDESDAGGEGEAIGLTCGCDDLVSNPINGIDCEEWVRAKWNESACGTRPERPTQGGMSDEKYQEALELWRTSGPPIGVGDPFCYHCFEGFFGDGVQQGIRQVGDGSCACLDCETAWIFGITEDAWGNDCISDIYQHGGTYCFRETVCIPDTTEYDCRIGFIGQWTQEIAFPSGVCGGCTLDPIPNCDQLRDEIGSCCVYEAAAVGSPPIHCLEMSKENCENLIILGDHPGGNFGIVNPDFIPDPDPVATLQCRKTSNDISQGENSPGVLDVPCDGIFSLRDKCLAPGGQGCDENRTTFSALRNCEPLEPENEGSGEDTGDGEANSGALNDCTFACNLHPIRFEEDGTPVYNPDNCFDEFDQNQPEGGILGSPCQVGYVDEDWYFYGRPGGWSWICSRDLNTGNQDRFPQLPRNGRGCGCVSDATCNPDEDGHIHTCGQPGETSHCNISPSGGPGCFSAAPFPQKTWSQPIRQCCCKCATASAFVGPDGGDVACGPASPCVSLDPCVLVNCIGGLCSVQCNENNPDCNCTGQCGEGGLCDCGGFPRNDCSLSGTFDEGCAGEGEGGECAVCGPPLRAICGSGCDDLGDDSGGAGCQPSDGGIGSIGVESQNFCSHMAISETCDGAWFKQINTSFKYDADDEIGLGYDCTYENNAFMVRVKCPDKDESIWDGPGCKRYCKEYDISWFIDDTEYPEGEEPEWGLYIPSINGVTIDIGQGVSLGGTPDAGGGPSIYPEFYSDCVHSVYQRDSSNAHHDLANCIGFQIRSSDDEDEPPEILEPFHRCASSPGHECKHGLTGGCGEICCGESNCESGECELKFGRDMESLVTVNRDIFGNIIPGDVDLIWVDMVLTTGNPVGEFNEILIPCRVILNDKKNPHVDIDPHLDYGWFHAPINRHRPNPSGAFDPTCPPGSQGCPTPDCCKCCSTDLSLQTGPGILCERAHGEDGNSSIRNSACSFIRKPSFGEGEPDPACGNICDEGHWCCPAVGHCIPFGVECEGCSDECPVGQNCCIRVNEQGETGPSCAIGDCEDFSTDSVPPGNFNITIPDNSCVFPRCVFPLNEPITVVAEEE